MIDRVDVGAHDVRARSWLPMLTLRPASGNSRRIVVSDPIQGRRASVDSSALLHLIAPSSADRERDDNDCLAVEFAARGWLPGTIPENLLSGMSMWWRRGWHPSLSYYLWSRRRTFADEQDVTGDIRRRMVRGYLDAGSPPRIPAVGVEEIPLPAATPVPDVSLGQLLLSRRTRRGYRTEDLDATTVSGVLAHGLADVAENRRLTKQDELEWLRSHGSSFDFYLVNYAISGLAPGVYQYDVEKHAVRCVEPGNLRNQMSSILVGMRAPETASFTLVVAARFAQYQWRYRHERALRSLYMSVGRVAQRLILTAQAYGLGSLPTPATRDSELCQLLHLDPKEGAAIYTLTMGPLRSANEETGQ